MTTHLLTRDRSPQSVLTVKSNGGHNFSEFIHSNYGIHVNAWIGGTDPSTIEAHYPVNGKTRGTGAVISYDDARELIKFLQAAIDNPHAPTDERCCKLR